MQRRPHLRHLLLAAATATASLLVPIHPAGAQAATTTEVRAAHFSPDAPAMDVYLADVSGQQRLVLPALAYGQVSQYMPLDAGTYTFSLRPAGSPPSSPAAITGSAALTGDGAYTFAAMGKAAQVRTALFADDLSSPQGTSAKVRLIQASSTAPQVDVRAVAGPVLADGVDFASATTYAEVPAGSWRLRVDPSGTAAPTTQWLDLQAGTVATLVVLDAQDGPGVRLTSVVDATGMGATTAAAAAVPSVVQVTPLGAVPTGLGGTAPSPEGPPVARVAVLTLLSLGALVVAGGWLVRRTAAVPVRVERDRRG